MKNNEFELKTEIHISMNNIAKIDTYTKYNSVDLVHRNHLCKRHQR